MGGLQPAVGGCAEQNFSEQTLYRYFTVKPLNANFLFQLVLCCCICLFQQVFKNIAQISLGKVIAPSLVVHLLQN